MTSVTIRSGGSRARSLERLPGRRAPSSTSQSREQARQVVAHVGVVVDDQDAFAGGRARLPAARRRSRPASLRGSSSGSHAPPPRRTAAAAAGAVAARPSRRRAPRGRCARPVGMRDRERRACVRCSLSTRNRPAVQPHQLLHQREADAGAFVRARCAPSTRWKRSNRRGSSCAGMPVPVSWTAQLDAAAVAPQRSTRITPSNVNLNAFDSRFRTIFSHMSRSTIDRLGERRRSRRRSAMPRVLDGRAEGARQLARERASRSVGSIGRLRAAGLDAREVEQRVDQLQQPQGVAVQRSRAVALRRAARRPRRRARPRSARASASAACGTRG